jgi:hypothetical protein
MALARQASRTFAILAATAWILAQQAAAQTYNIVQIRAFDSRGMNTGKCLSTTPSNALVLDTCFATNPFQWFAFDTNGAGGVGARLVGLVNLQGNMVVQKCLGVATGSTLPNGGWSVRAPVVSAPAPCPNTAGISMSWRWVGSQIIAMDSPGRNSCLTFVQAWGPNARLGDCSKPETLTAWDIVINSCARTAPPGSPCKLP